MPKAKAKAKRAASATAKVRAAAKPVVLRRSKRLQEAATKRKHKSREAADEDDDMGQALQPVNAAPMSFSCDLCKRFALMEDRFLVHECQHALCRDSAHVYFVERLKDKEATIKCPVQGCGATISRSEMAVVMTEEELRRFGETAGETMRDVEVSETTTFFCEICQSENPMDDRFLVGACKHMFCRDMIHKYLMTRIESEDATPKCPIDGCDAIITDVDMALVLTPEEQHRYYNMSFKIGVQTSTDLHRCLDESCGGAVWLDQGDTHFECPLCEAERCVTCNTRTWHENETCEQYQTRVRDNELQPEQLRALFGSHDKTYMCGGCGFGPIEHVFCSNLQTHHHEMVGPGSCVNNACPQCGWYVDDIAEWPRWDGVAWSERHLRPFTRPLPAKATPRRHAAPNHQARQPYTARYYRPPPPPPFNPFPLDYDSPNEGNLLAPQPLLPVTVTAAAFHFHADQIHHEAADHGREVRTGHARHLTRQDAGRHVAQACQAHREASMAVQPPPARFEPFFQMFDSIRYTFGGRPAHAV